MVTFRIVSEQIKILDNLDSVVLPVYVVKVEVCLIHESSKRIIEEHF